MDSEKFSVRGRALGDKLQKRLAAICEGMGIDQKSKDVANWIRKGITIEGKSRVRGEVVMVALVHAVMLIESDALCIGVAAPDCGQWCIMISSDGGVIPTLYSHSLEHSNSYSITRITI